MNKKKRSEQPSINISGNVTNFTVVSESSKFAISQVDKSGVRLTDILSSMLTEVQQSLPEGEERRNIEEAILATGASKDKNQHLENYKSLISVVKPTYDVLIDFTQRIGQLL